MRLAMVLLALLALLRRHSLGAKLGAERLWIRASWPAVITGVAFIVGMAQWLSPTQLGWGLPLIAIALHRPVADGRLVADVPDVLDVSTPIGVAVLIGCGAVLFALGQPTGTLLLLPVFLSGTRAHLPPTPAEASASLRSFASMLRLPADAPPMSFSCENEGNAPRVRVHLPTSRAGLLTIAFVMTSSSMGFLRKRSIMLLVQTRAQSDADDLMRRRVKEARESREPDGTILRLVQWDAEAVELLRVLARRAPRPARASRGTWLLREISEPGRKAA